MRFNATGFKLIILDECDSMTKDAQFALRRIIEKYTKHTRFCLIGNYVSKIIPALQSRCTRFRFAPLGPESVRERVKHVVACEGVEITEQGLAAVQTLGAGDMRRTLNILQSSYLAKEDPNAPLDADAVYATTGQPRPADVEAIAGVLLNEPFAEAARRVEEIKTSRGLALGDVARLLCEYVFRLHMPGTARAALVSDMADIEHRLAHVTHERMQLLALVGAFSNAKEAIVNAAR
jgi:replication factor C subunit 3/5